MKIAVIVTDFPKVTETFVLRDLMYFNGEVHEIRVYHITRFRDGETIHEFGRPAIAWARYVPFFFSAGVFRALIRTRPHTLYRIARDMLVRLWKYPVFLAKSLALLPKAVAISEEIEEWGADHVHAEFAGHPATCAWIVGRCSNIPYSVSCHAHGIFRNQALLDVTLGEAGAIRCISEYNRRFLYERIPALTNSDIDVIHVGLDLTEFSLYDNRLSPDGFNILYVGSLTPKKGVKHLLSAIANTNEELGDWHCEIVGGGPDSQALKNQAIDAGIDARIRFSGPLPAEQVRDAMRRANVLVVPSIMGPGGRAEGIPTVLMEAMALGVPVIASRLTGIPELVHDDKNGLLVEPGDESELVTALRRIESERGLGQRLSDMARKTVEEGFNLSDTGARQLALFERHSAGAKRS